MGTTSTPDDESRIVRIGLILNDFHDRNARGETIRRLFRELLAGLEAAQILLGHSSALVTEAVYAERDQNKAKQIAQKIG